MIIKDADKQVKKKKEKHQLFYLFIFMIDLWCLFK